VLSQRFASVAGSSLSLYGFALDQSVAVHVLFRFPATSSGKRLTKSWWSGAWYVTVRPIAERAAAGDARRGRRVERECFRSEGARDNVEVADLGRNDVGRWRTGTVRLTET